MEKHNLIPMIEKFIKVKKVDEFFVTDLANFIQKNSLASLWYYEGTIRDLCVELVASGYLSVKYVSERKTDGFKTSHLFKIKTS
jgi:hypothetical protein